jgi:hypothetical protein
MPCTKNSAKLLGKGRVASIHDTSCIGAHVRGVQGGTNTIGSWAADRVAILRKDVEAAHMSAEQWGDALDFGLHNFIDIGASVQRMLVAGETQRSVVDN